MTQATDREKEEQKVPEKPACPICGGKYAHSLGCIYTKRRYGRD